MNNETKPRPLVFLEVLTEVQELLENAQVKETGQESPSETEPTIIELNTALGRNSISDVDEFPG